jgi:hypothetical protein
VNDIVGIGLTGTVGVISATVFGTLSIIDAVGAVLGGTPLTDIGATAPTPPVIVVCATCGLVDGGVSVFAIPVISSSPIPTLYAVVLLTAI